MEEKSLVKRAFDLWQRLINFLLFVWRDEANRSAVPWSHSIPVRFSFGRVCKQIYVPAVEKLLKLTIHFRRNFYRVRDRERKPQRSFMFKSKLILLPIMFR